MATSPDGAYRRQDYQILGGPHPQEQWDPRAPDGWEGYPVRVAWREAADVHVPGMEGYCRFHTASGMVLASKWGFHATAVPLDWHAPGEQRIVYDQLEDDTHE